MKKVLIIGSCGAGKSTAAKRLGEITGLPVIHLDAHYWKPGWVKTSRDEWLKKVEEYCAQPAWIIDGNFETTMEYRFQQADTIIFLFYPRRTCVWGIFKRLFINRRVDEVPGCKEKVDWQFFKYVWTFNKLKAPEILKKIEALKDQKVFIVKNRGELDRLFERLGVGSKI